MVLFSFEYPQEWEFWKEWEFYNLGSVFWCLTAIAVQLFYFYFSLWDTQQKIAHLKTYFGAKNVKHHRHLSSALKAHHRVGTPSLSVACPVRLPWCLLASVHPEVLVGFCSALCSPAGFTEFLESCAVSVACSVLLMIFFFPDFWKHLYFFPKPSSEGSL